MTIIQLGRTTQITDRTSPDNVFVRAIRLGPFTTDPALLSTFPGLDESGRTSITLTDVRDSSGATYQRRLSVADVYVEPISWYFDSDTQILYVHVAPTDSPYSTTYLYGLSQGYTDSRLIYIDNEQYLPLIKSAPNIRQQQDISGAGRLSFITGSVSLTNSGGRLDDLIPAPVYGNDVLIYNVSDRDGQDDYTSADLMQLSSLFVEDYDLSNSEINLRIQDRRKAQNIDVPTDRFTTTDYPAIESEIAGKVIPVLWGTAREIPTVNTNGTTSAGDVKYRAAILLTALGTVQVETDAGWTAVTPLSSSLATGEFTLSAGDARDANGNALPAKLVEPTGIAITYITDIIRDASLRFGNVPITASNYDLDEWAAEETAIANGGYYIDSEKRLFDLILDLQNGSNIGFRYEIKPDGRRTFRADDESRAVAAYVPNIIIENINDLRVSTDSSLLAAEIVVKYGISYQSGRALRYVDSSNRQNVLDTYSQAPRREYPRETDPVITTEAAAIERANYAKARFGSIRGIIEITILCADDTRRHLMGLRIYDIINIEITPSTFVDRDANSIVGREFYGIKRCKVLSIGPDARRSVNTITAVIIGDPV